MAVATQLREEAKGLDRGLKSTYLAVAEAMEVGCTHDRLLLCVGGCIDPFSLLCRSSLGRLCRTAVLQ